MSVAAVIEQFEVTCRARSGNTDDLLATLRELENATRTGVFVNIRAYEKGAFELLFFRAIDAEVLGDYSCAAQLYRTALSSLQYYDETDAICERRAHCEGGMIRCEMLEEGQLYHFDHAVLSAQVAKYTQTSAAQHFKAQIKFTLFLYLIFYSSPNSTLLILTKQDLAALPPPLSALGQLFAAVAELQFGDQGTAAHLLSALADNDFISYAVPALFRSANALEAAKRNAVDEAMSTLADALEFMPSSCNPLYDGIALVCCIYAVGFTNKKKRAEAIAKHAIRLERFSTTGMAKGLLINVAIFHDLLKSPEKSRFSVERLISDEAKNAALAVTDFLSHIGYTLGKDFPTLTRRLPIPNIIDEAFFRNSMENNSFANDHAMLIALQAILGRESRLEDADRVEAAGTLLAKQLRLAPASIIRLQINILSDAVSASANANRLDELPILLDDRPLCVDDRLFDSIKKMAKAITVNSARLRSAIGRRSIIDEIGNGTFVANCHSDVVEASLCLLGILPIEQRIATELATIRMWKQ